MKGQILKILRKENEVVSGEMLSSELGITRVSIWKHIRRLRESGYSIIGTPKGYRLINSPDIPFSWEFPERESQIHYFSEVTSTMDVAKDLARKGCPDFTVVVAGRQKKGRGRLKRIWFSSEGGLYFTIVLRPKISPVVSFKINFSASLVLAQILRNMFGIKAMVKWPNDILVDGKKISGMLSEMEAEADMITFLNIGLGINVNNDPTSEEPMAASLKKVLGREISKKEILARYLEEFEKRLNNVTLDNVISEWKQYTLTLNRHVKIVANHEVSEGFAIDVDENGALVLGLEDGSTKRVIYGDCFHT
jgi:BirA family biotin operon repressor/biotin-[acetyl-CoA-carboxylase] ligase